MTEDCRFILLECRYSVQGIPVGIKQIQDTKLLQGLQGK